MSIIFFCSEVQYELKIFVSFSLLVFWGLLETPQPWWSLTWVVFMKHPCAWIRFWAERAIIIAQKLNWYKSFDSFRTWTCSLPLYLVMWLLVHSSNYSIVVFDLSFSSFLMEMFGLYWSNLICWSINSWKYAPTKTNEKVFLEEFC